jgi:hypothetical protein
MKSTQIRKIQEAIVMLQEAQLLVREALGNTDSSDMSFDNIQEAIFDLKADIKDLA